MWPFNVFLYVFDKYLIGFQSKDPHMLTEYALTYWMTSGVLCVLAKLMHRAEIQFLFYFNKQLKATACDYILTGKKYPRLTLG